MKTGKRRLSVPGSLYWAIFAAAYVASFPPVVRFADGHESRGFQHIVMLMYAPLIILTEGTEMQLNPRGGEGLLFIYD
jgi:hypothetical protein